MTFTYDLTKLNTPSDANQTLYQVRYLIGDTDSAVTATNKRLEDEEIKWRLVEQGSVYAAAAACCEDLLAKWARREVGTVGHQNDSRFNFLTQRAVRLRELSVGEVLWNATGISLSDKETAVLDTDRTHPAFATQIMDNPNAPHGNPNEDDSDELF